MRGLFLLFSSLLLVYMLWPGPNSIQSFLPLPNSVKSTLSGDTTEIPNVSAYFSNNYRNFVIPFYKNNYQMLTFTFISPLRLNHPPEYAFTAIKKHTESTYLEELVYPLRDSLYINGFEPFYQDGEPKYDGASKFQVEGNYFDTKVTLRYYPSTILIRIIVWFGIILAVYLNYFLGKKIILNK